MKHAVVLCLTLDKIKGAPTFPCLTCSMFDSMNLKNLKLPQSLNTNTTHGATNILVLRLNVAER